MADPSDRSAYAFRGPLTKRMTAEQFADALSTVTGVWPEVSDDMVRVDGRGQGGQVAAARAAVAAERRGQRGRPARPAGSRPDGSGATPTPRTTPAAGSWSAR